jgi:hypothetical protein
LKTNPSFTKEIRAILEQNLVKKLETLGINAVRSFIFVILASSLYFVFSIRKDQRREESLLALSTFGGQGLIQLS